MAVDKSKNFLTFKQQFELASELQQRIDVDEPRYKSKEDAANQLSKLLSCEITVYNLNFILKNCDITWDQIVSYKAKRATSYSNLLVRVKELEAKVRRLEAE